MSRPSWRMVLSACCLASLGLNVLLAAALQRTNESFRVDPFELEHYGTIQPASFAGPDLLRVVIYGDSRARSWPEPMTMSGVVFENRGIGYQTSTQVLGRLDNDVLGLRPHVLVLQVGINDLKAQVVDAAQRRRVIRRLEENLRQIVTRSVLSHVHVVALTIIPTGPVPWYRQPTVASDIEAAVREVNSYLQSLATDDVSVLDTNALLADGHGWLRAEYRQDFLHVNGAGYDVLDRALHERLLTLLPRLRAMRFHTPL